ncbi:MAG: cob(I)yrinic acid a,c-diamide adenosyltransferase [Candidatus Marsarchaeota archaeon]|nr:cob(I)yrinic acid a,c-diamide adenosyltransferase [Candidatus Marsarchaeota archaeon]
MRYYTGKGDEGFSGLLGEGRFAKNDPIIVAVGEVDELNSSVGVALYYARDNVVRPQLREIQNELFIIGASIASLQNGKVAKAKLSDGAVSRLEEAIEDMGRRIPELKKFVIPGGCEAAVHLHLARSVARRAERAVVSAAEKHKLEQNIKSYMNRLSSYLFVAALYLNYTEGIKESHPTY